MRIAVVFSKQRAAEVEATALSRSMDECGRFFDEDTGAKRLI
jgi:hypothetical protein